MGINNIVQSAIFFHSSHYTVFFILNMYYASRDQSLMTGYITIVQNITPI